MRGMTNSNFRYALRLLLFFLLWLQTASSSAKDPPGPMRNPPSVQSVISAALQHAGFSSWPMQSWSSRLRLAAILPSLSIRGGRTLGVNEYFSNPGEGPNDFNWRGYSTWTWEIRGQWDLSRLIFDHFEPTAANKAAQLATQRQRLVEDVATFYFEHYHLVTILASYPADGDLNEKRDLEIKRRRLTAMLYELTGGKFFKEP